MFMRSALASSIAAIALTATAFSAQAAPASLNPATAAVDGRQTLIQPIRSTAKPVRRIVSAGQSAGDKCGVWRCTWPTSGGGCLVWEKTLCKIKTIDPFN